jgi:hypothetical protein
VSDSITIAHAGSLIRVLTHDLGPAFTKQTGYIWTNIAGPAVGLANRIRSGASTLLPRPGWLRRAAKQDVVHTQRERTVTPPFGQPLQYDY